MAKLCLVTTDSSLPQALGTANRYRDVIDLIELRADFLDPGEMDRIDGFPAMAPLPVILTHRTRDDGGRFEGTTVEHHAVLARAAGAGFAFVDLEHDAPEELAATIRAAGDTRIIRSMHDFNGTPDDLPTLIKSLPRNPSDVAKIAVTPHGIADTIRLLQAARAEQGIDRIVIGMGPFGVPLRLLAGKLGCLLTFTAESRDGAPPAPGMIGPEEMRHLYRVGEIDESTPVYAVIGNPVLHSRSPEIHNPALERVGASGRYIPIPVDRIDLLPELASEIDLLGCSVTIPHKQAILELLGEDDEAVRRIGSCNTIDREPGSDASRWRGTNTDAAGFLAPLERHLAAQDAAGLEGASRGDGLTCWVIGAGGAARAVVHALTSAGHDVLVANRTAERAAALAADFAAGHATMAALPDLVSSEATRPDLIVQTTSVGMDGGPAGDPIESVELAGVAIVYDLVYRPAETPLLARARSCGCAVIGGIDMLIDQGIRQFTRFTGIDYPRDLRESVRNLLQS